ncbi:DoxX family protein [Mesorhizobium sp. WSM2239]|uniref:DoxX family protein n=2 Tax=unclassified Mesorhizobium TaxID=325217 RepID=A0AAU8DH47_9HYPH
MVSTSAGGDRLRNLPGCGDEAGLSLTRVSCDTRQVHATREGCDGWCCDCSLGRIIPAGVFILASFDTLGNIDGITVYFAALGLPVPLAMTFASAHFELSAGVCVLVGFHTRIASWLLAVCLVAAYVAHYGQGGDNPALVLMNTKA